jgi:hypothetical protein
VARVKRTKTALFAKLKTELEDLDNKSVRVGFFESAKYADGTSVAYVAAIQEFGYSQKNIPPRSFMRTSASEKDGEWSDVMKNALRSGASVGSALDLVGQKAVGDIKEKIISIESPPLAQSTIKARINKMANGKKVGNLTKPLVESGIMLKSVTHQVDE